MTEAIASYPVDPFHVRLIEALIFAATEPVDEAEIAGRLPEGTAIEPLLAVLQERYAGAGVMLTRIAGGWTFRTAPDLAGHLRIERPVKRRLGRAALETLAVIAYHQPTTRAEIEDIRGVAVAKGTLDLLIETGWVKPGRRRDTPGRPLTWLTTDRFLSHFGLAGLEALPGVEELRAAGLIETGPGARLSDEGGFMPDPELPLEADEPDE